MALVAKKAPLLEIPMAQQAEDRLWKFQFRKERDQLIAKLDAQQEQLSTLNNDTRKAIEKLNTKLNIVEKKVDKLEVDERSLRKEKSKIRDELHALKGKVGLVEKDFQQQKELENGKLLLSRVWSFLLMPSLVSGNKNQMATKKALVPHPQNLQPATEISRDVHIDRGRPLHTNTVVPHPPSDDGTDDLSATPRVSTSSNTREMAERQHLETVQFHEISTQGTSTLQAYLTMADSLMAPFFFRPISGRSETGFVKMFLDGMTNQDERETIIRTLQNGLVNVTTSSNGSMETIVRWPALKEAVKKSKLLEVTNTTATESRPAIEQVNNAAANLVANGKLSNKPRRHRKKRKLLYDDDEDVE